MKKEQTMGLIRDSLTALGALAFASFTGWPQVVGIIMLVVGVVWALIYHEGAEMIYTSIRKLLAAAPGLLVEMDIISSVQGTNAVAFLLPLAALVWGYLNNGPAKPTNFPVWLILLGTAALLLPSCGSCLTSTGSKGGLEIQTKTCFDLEGKIISQETKPIQFNIEDKDNPPRVEFMLTK